MNSDGKFIGSIIKQFRTSHNITLASLADGICTKDHLCSVEHDRSQPSFYLLDQLSKRLNVNLYEYYNTIMLFESIEAYSLSNEIFKYISNYELIELKYFINQHETNEIFQKGEPRKNLLYGKAVVENEFGNYQESLDICLNILSSENIDFHEASLDIKLYNHVELLILNLTAINYHCLNRFDEALHIYDIIHIQLSHILSHETYELYQNLYFETKLFLNVSSNLALLKINNEKFIEAEKIINIALDTAQKMKLIHCHCELLFGKCTIFYYTNRIEQAKSLLKEIEIFSKYEHKEKLYNDFIQQAKSIHPKLFE